MRIGIALKRLNSAGTPASLNYTRLTKGLTQQTSASDKEKPADLAVAG
jgi:ribosomal protein L20